MRGKPLVRGQAQLHDTVRSLILGQLADLRSDRAADFISYQRMLTRFCTT